jgi:hypothetical protein
MGLKLAMHHIPVNPDDFYADPQNPWQKRYQYAAAVHSKEIAQARCGRYELSVN